MFVFYGSSEPFSSLDSVNFVCDSAIPNTVLLKLPPQCVILDAFSTIYDKSSNSLVMNCCQPRISVTFLQNVNSWQKFKTKIHDKQKFMTKIQDKNSWQTKIQDKNSWQKFTSNSWQKFQFSCHELLSAKDFCNIPATFIYWFILSVEYFALVIYINISKYISIYQYFALVIYINILGIQIALYTCTFF